MVLTCLGFLLGGFVQALSSSLASESAQCEHFILAILKGKWQSSQPGSSPNLVLVLRVHMSAQLAADAKHVERAHVELLFFLH